MSDIIALSKFNTFPSPFTAHFPTTRTASLQLKDIKTAKLKANIQKLMMNIHNRLLAAGHIVSLYSVYQTIMSS